ncbi:hypothetical protein NPIL_452031 [Nephila pilipes]|uniref:Uncharacterized protein n=1 Tax=Nephila pilipes TaxID=299642 RepID=A0A8X6UMS3_NEPPI|nr:hypothetical protein NPIL_452031 [Nephila pilipes]
MGSRQPQPCQAMAATFTICRTSAVKVRATGHYLQGAVIQPFVAGTVFFQTPEFRQHLRRLSYGYILSSLSFEKRTNRMKKEIMKIQSAKGVKRKVLEKQVKPL